MWQSGCVTRMRAIWTSAALRDAIAASSRVKTRGYEFFPLRNGEMSCTLHNSKTKIGPEKVRIKPKAHSEACISGD